MDVDVFAVNAELEVSGLRVVELSLQRLSHGQIVVMLWGNKEHTHRKLALGRGNQPRH